MPEDLYRWGISELNQFFLQKSKEFREGVKSGKQPEELEHLYWLMKQVHSEMRSRRLAYVPDIKEKM